MASANSASARTTRAEFGPAPACSSPPPVRTGEVTHTCQPLKWWQENALHFPNVSVCQSCSSACAVSPPKHVNRTTPVWAYDWDKFPAFWFGANASGFENSAQLKLIGKYSLVLFGWQHMQLACNYSNLLKAQVTGPGDREGAAL